MTIIWIIFGAIGILVLGLLIIAAFVKKDYVVERSIVVKSTNEDTFNFIRLLKNQDRFNKWSNLDPHMIKETIGTDGTVGFVSKWESNHKQVGHGEQEIKGIVEGERIESELRFIKPFSGVAQAYLTTQPTSENETLVTWGFTSTMKYPMNILLVFMNMEKMLGNDFEFGLSNLKKILENKS